jgi:hypothetical protein
VTETQRAIPSAHPARHEPPPAASTGCLRRKLDELTDLAMGMARAVAADVQEVAAARHAARVAADAAPEKPAGPAIMEAPPAVWDRPVLAFHRIARVVRLCVALATRLDSGQLELGARRAKPQAAATPREPRAKAELEAVVTDTIETEVERAEQATLKSALGALLERDEIERYLDRYSPEELVAWACRELGLPPRVEDEPQGGERVDIDAPDRRRPTPDDDGPAPFQREGRAPSALARSMAQSRIARWRRKNPSG